MIDPASCVIIIRNEVSRIDECLLGVLGKFDEVLVVDQESDDGTQERLGHWEKIERSLRWVTDVAWGTSEPSRPMAIREAKNDWIFLLDCDEEPTTYFVKRLPQLLKSGPRFFQTPRLIFIGDEGLKPYDMGCRRLFHRKGIHVPTFPEVVDYLHSSVSPVDGRICQLPYPCIVSIKSQQEQDEDSERYYGLGYPRPSSIEITEVSP